LVPRNEEEAEDLSVFGDRFGVVVVHSRAVPRLTAIAILGLVLFNPPFLTLFDRPAEFAGIPLQFLYLLAAWLIIVLLTGLVSRKVPDEIRKPDAPTMDGGAGI